MMKALIALMLIASGAAQAFDFAAATDGTYGCANYCYGYTTSDPAYAVDYVNMVYSGLTQIPTGWTNHYTMVLSVSGVAYRAYNVAYPDKTLFKATDISGSGATILAKVKDNAVRLGCGRNCTRTAYQVTGGAVTVN